MDFSLLLCFVCTLSPLLVQSSGDHLLNVESKPSSPFSAALETLEKQIGYTFQSIDLLRCAMTHSSYSIENNRALSILGLNIIDTWVSLRSIQRNPEISAKDLNNRISEISSGDSCATQGFGLGLEKVVRVSTKTNSSTPSVVCEAFRAMFGAIAIDSSNVDTAGDVFWEVHGGDDGLFSL
eukprot:TRINITY_DN10973_c0_g1_i2.p1 TRINITY_DN10973_c0_g1~~TRINITY_DN10973_c0_g1_i2.p1  ORF type:complete len:181 (-),score=21.59 TRINITY_DN10973_c0_g1_i2:84-626(-)